MTQEVETSRENSKLSLVEVYTMNHQRNGMQKNNYTCAHK